MEKLISKHWHCEGLCDYVLLNFWEVFNVFIRYTSWCEEPDPVFPSYIIIGLSYMFDLQSLVNYYANDSTHNVILFGRLMIWKFDGILLLDSCFELLCERYV